MRLSVCGGVEKRGLSGLRRCNAFSATVGRASGRNRKISEKRRCRSGTVGWCPLSRAFHLFLLVAGGRCRGSRSFTAFPPHSAGRCALLCSAPPIWQGLCLFCVLPPLVDGGRGAEEVKCDKKTNYPVGGFTNRGFFDILPEETNL